MGFTTNNNIIRSMHSLLAFLVFSDGKNVLKDIVKPHLELYGDIYLLIYEL